MGRIVGGKTYLLPYGFYLRAMFYNKKLFEQAGVKEPPKTLDEFLDKTVPANIRLNKMPRMHTALC